MVANSLTRVLGDLLRVTNPFLSLAKHLFQLSLGLLIFTTHQLPSLLLHFAGDIFDCPFDLVFIHDFSLRIEWKLLPFGISKELINRY